MAGELEPGMRVRLHRPMLGYQYAELVEKYWPYWLVRLSSGYEFTLYEDEFDVEG